MNEITAIIGGLPLPEMVREHAIAVYGLVAEAESHAHGKPVDQVHFHEVGAMDAVADVVAVCLLMEELKPDRVLASPVHVGSGQTRCAHGIMPVPAPATALASLTAVCPPNWTITPSGCSSSRTFNTSSSARGSK